MKCFQCVGTYKEISDRLEVNDPYVGTIIIQGIRYFKCDKCGDILYTEEMARAIESERNKHMEWILSGFPMSNFINATETASILGISRQALHKNRRIAHGFIYKVTFGGNTIYLRQSVIQFKKTGDGRFPLNIHEYSPSSQYVEETIPMELVPVYNHQATTERLPQPLFRNPLTSSLEERCYAN